MAAENALGTKERILEAAVRLFAASGFHKGSMRELARAVGVKESSLYNHYRGKDALLEAILEYRARAFAAAIPPPEAMDALFKAATDPVSLWLGVADALESRLDPLVDAIDVIIMNEMLLDARCRRYALDVMFEEQKRITARLLEAMAGLGLIRRLDYGLAASAYVHMVHGIKQEQRLRALEGRESLESEAEMRAQIVQFVEGLRQG